MGLSCKFSLNQSSEYHLPILSIYLLMAGLEQPGQCEDPGWARGGKLSDPEREGLIYD